MSLFDVIKYPISRPPTEEELSALPGELLEQWREKVGWNAGIKFIVLFYQARSFLGVEPPSLTILRNLILEYNDESI